MPILPTLPTGRSWPTSKAELCRPITGRHRRPLTFRQGACILKTRNGKVNYEWYAGALLRRAHREAGENPAQCRCCIGEAIPTGHWSVCSGKTGNRARRLSQNTCLYMTHKKSPRARESAVVYGLSIVLLLYSFWGTAFFMPIFPLFRRGQGAVSANMPPVPPTISPGALSHRADVCVLKSSSCLYFARKGRLRSRSRPIYLGW